MLQKALDASLGECDPAAKCRRVDALRAAVSETPLNPGHSGSPPPAGWQQRPVLVSPSRLPRRGVGSLDGRIVRLHAVAHIAFNAINLEALELAS